MFRAQLLQLSFWFIGRLVGLYLNYLHSLTLCFAGRESRTATPTMTVNLREILASPVRFLIKEQNWHLHPSLLHPSRSPLRHLRSLLTPRLLSDPWIRTSAGLMLGHRLIRGQTPWWRPMGNQEWTELSLSKEGGHHSKKQPVNKQQTCSNCASHYNFFIYIGASLKIRTLKKHGHFL